MRDKEIERLMETVEQEGKSMERWSFNGYFPAEMKLDSEGKYIFYADHITALAAKDAAIVSYKDAVLADIGAFRRDSATLEAQAEQIRKTDIIVGDMSMLIRMMVTKHRRGKLDEEYCQKALDYLQRKGLQGNILRALASTAPVAEAGQDFQDALTHIDMLTELVGDLAQEINYVRDLGGQAFLSSSYPGSLKRADEFLNSIAREDHGGSK